MNLTEAVKVAIEYWGNCTLAAEVTLGKANQVDFVGTHSKYGEIRVELERRREDPLNNVVKAWRQASKNTNEEFLLIHIFSGFYISKKSKYENAIFIGEQINFWATSRKRKTGYLSVLLDYIPAKGASNPIVTEEEALRINSQVSEQLNLAINRLEI